MDVLLNTCKWVLSILSSLSVQDWCVATQAVAAGGSAGLLWCSVGQHAGQPHCATARLGLYSHTFWPHGVLAPANTHARLRPQTGGECLCLCHCTHVVWSTFNDEDLHLLGYFCILDMFQSCFSLVLQSALSLSFVTCLNFLSSVCLQLKSVCLSLQDSNVLVQRNMLEILLYFFPIATCLVGTHINTLPIFLDKKQDLCTL